MVRGTHEQRQERILRLKNTELQVHNCICDYLKLQYPHVLFTSESSGLYLPLRMARNIARQRSCSGLPDLFIMHKNDHWGGLFLEIKKNREQVFYKNGNMRTQHIIRQYEILKRLQAQNYLATFAFGFDDAKNTIDLYMRNQILQLLNKKIDQ